MDFREVVELAKADPSYLASMRHWLADCDLPARRGDADTIALVERNYDGGLEAFVRDEGDARYLAATAWRFEEPRIVPLSCDHEGEWVPTTEGARYFTVARCRTCGKERCQPIVVDAEALTPA